MEGFALEASDGPIGSVVDLLFDDVTWRIRWLVIDTGGWLGDRKILLPPSALGHVNHIGHQYSVLLTKQQIKDSPSVNTDEPVSRQMETGLYDYLGWAPYWSTGFYMGGYGYTGGMMEPPGPGFAEAQAKTDHAATGDAHLRSVREVTGYLLEATNGEIGHVADFLVEDADWSIHYLVADTRNWWPGKHVLVSPRSITSIDWSPRLVHVDISRETLKGSPAYDGSQAVDRAYEYAFHGYYDGKRVVEPA
ncbi:PRC-barrel domain-containing protein (plasmid) [Polymorphobacter megasporae]|nr:PRC-barrel domain-containing protein [Polymorphobacter sp. PAMC 29334]UAJ12912.1 PRC-barrel domain-containing protein [Polymorphobacter megasporae]